MARSIAATAATVDAVDTAEHDLDALIPEQAARYSRKALARLIGISSETPRLYVANERLPSLPVAVAWARRDPVFRAHLTRMLSENSDGWDE